MDYLIFMIGLFLLTAGAGAIMLYRIKPRRNRWLWLAAALGTLGLESWSGLLAFAIGAEDVSVRILDAAYGSIFIATLVGFCLCPFGKDNKLLRLIRWIAILLVLFSFFAVGLRSIHSPGFLIPAALIAFAAGWRIPTWKRGDDPRLFRFGPSLFTALVFSIITIVSMLPGTVETTYDIFGKGQSPARIAFLIAMTVSAAGTLTLVFSLWEAVISPGDSGLSANLLRRKKLGNTIILTASIITVTNGAWLAHWLGTQAEKEQISTLLSAIRLGSSTLEAELIPSIQGERGETLSEAYLTLRSRLINIKQALPKTRFVYLAGIRNGNLVFLVDAEDPGSPDFSPPGSPLDEHVHKWLHTLGGHSLFSPAPEADRWGVWYTATLPIYAPGEKQAVAALGVDYPARLWIEPFAARRLAAMGVTVSVASLLLALFVLHLASIEHTSRVDQLSERLSDAMKAAEFDTWEWFPKTLRLSMGERVSSMLGWSNSISVNPLRQIWRRVHPEDRRQLLKLLRTSPEERQLSSEAEIRLRNQQGRWLWFMLRGRIIGTDPHSQNARVVGTILNIDESHRSRIEIDKQRRFALHVMESVPNGLAVVSHDGFLAYANPAFIRMAKRGENQLIGLPVHTLIHTAHQIPTDRVGFEARLQRPDGTDIPIQAFQAPLEESGKEAGSILAVIDLTAIKETEKALRRSRAEADRLAFVAKRTDNAVIITDAKGHIEWVNEGFTRMSGYHRDEVLGKPGFLLGMHANSGSRGLISSRLAAGRGFEEEVLNLTKDGRSYLTHIECQPLFDKNAVLTGFMAIQRDITRARRSAILLEAVASVSTSLLSATFEDSMWESILEAMGRAAGVDRSYLFAIHPHTVTGKPSMTQLSEWNSGAAAAQIDNPSLQDFCFETNRCLDWYQAWRSGHDVAGVITDFPPEQQRLMAPQDIRSLVMVPIFAGDHLWGMMGLDVCTEDRVWENWEISIFRSAAANIGLRIVAQGESDALRQARDEAHAAAVVAEKANKAKSTFLATMSHEIRTPLNAVIGMASLLETTSLNSQQKDYAETILRSSHFLLELINDILDYSRIESGKIELDSSPFSLPELCREVFEVIRVAAMGKEIELICRIAPNLPAQVIGDMGRLRQILVNLLGNAVKFTHGGFVSLMVEGEERPDGRWQIAFQVKDSGIGIAPDSMDKLFKPFIQEDSSTTRRFGGSGLGLAISKRLAELMDGDITVRSIQGRGSSFIASVNLAPTEEPAPAQLPPLIRPGGGLRVLVVDDNDLNRRILEEILAGWGISCQAADSASAALSLWKQNGPFDLVLTDYRMPQTNGADLVRAIRALPDSLHTRCVLLGSDTGYPAEVRGLFHEVGNKPLWPATIQAMLSRLFPDPDQKAQTASPPPEEFDIQRLGSLKVLVAEDNPNNQKVVRLLLRRLGIEPDIVENGRQAVDSVTSRRYDIVLMDVQMPVMDGLEATRRIHAAKLQHRPYIVALTANAFQEDRDAAAEAGMDGYLSKPVTLAGLRKTLAEITQSSTL